ncbi:MAG: restriction endonuclease subunit S [Veillonella sp.]|uniref:Type I restriction modification DNA specificity domain-containing protein n=2 Tax=Veillonella dispar DORA_11 TaxID=1403949 RepID=W1UWP1_9FIRM|nr:restriction endonuclease subunit S [Veillonella sp.]ETI98196.1 MAG: hypothetical protein Q619_VDC00556G0018 [Veillonella dispar DORA_11]MDU5097787.1 restriction endonuclease subunit S [Veillonella sp.]
MTPQQLRNSILQLAMEGKLVEQRLEEGTGEELYQLIQEEKQELIKAGKLKKQKELSEIAEDEIPFEIPTAWKWVKLGNVINYFMGKTPPRAEPEWWGRDIPWISISDMSDYGFIKMSKELVSTKAINEKFTRISRAGTLLMSFKLTVGRTSILDTDAVHNEAIISILPYVDSSNSFRDYLFYFLPTIVQWGNYKNAIKGKTLNSKSISNLYIPLPPIGEQKRIVEKITKILPITDRYEKLWLRLNELNKRFPEDLQKSILQEAIQGKLFRQKDEAESAKSLIEKILLEREGLIEAGQIKKQKALPPIQEDEVPFDIPDSWCWERLGNISTYNQTKPKVKAIDLKESTWVLDLEDIEKNTGNILERINAKDKKVSGDKLVFYKDQLLYSKLRPYLKKILIAPDDGVCTPELVPFNILGGCNTNYILSVLKSPYVDFFINSVTYGVKMPRVSVETMVNLLIPIPTIKVQNNIAEMIEKVNSLCDKLRILIK